MSSFMRTKTVHNLSDRKPTSINAIELYVCVWVAFTGWSLDHTNMPHRRHEPIYRGPFSGWFSAAADQTDARCVIGTPLSRTRARTLLVSVQRLVNHLIYGLVRSGKYGKWMRSAAASRVRAIRFGTNYPARVRPPVPNALSTTVPGESGRGCGRALMHCNLLARMRYVRSGCSCTVR